MQSDRERGGVAESVLPVVAWVDCAAAVSGEIKEAAEESRMQAREFRYVRWIIASQSGSGVGFL